MNNSAVNNGATENRAKDDRDLREGCIDAHLGAGACGEGAAANREVLPTRGAASPGRAVNARESQYGEEHLSRLRVVRVLVTGLGLTIAQVRHVLDVLDGPQRDPYQAMGEATKNLPLTAPASQTSTPTMTSPWCAPWVSPTSSIRSWPASSAMPCAGRPNQASA